MKKIFAILIAVLFLVSCSAKYDGDPFLPFAGEIQTRVTLDMGGDISEFVYWSESDKIEFFKPNELSGYTLCRENGVFYLKYDSLALAVSEPSARVLLLCESVLAPHSATSISAGRGESGAFTVVKTKSCEYTFSQDGIPVSVQGTYGKDVFKMTLSDFKVISK